MTTLDPRFQHLTETYWSEKKQLIEHAWKLWEASKGHEMRTSELIAFCSQKSPLFEPRVQLKQSYRHFAAQKTGLLHWDIHSDKTHVPTISNMKFRSRL